MWLLYTRSHQPRLEHGGDRVSQAPHFTEKLLWTIYGFWGEGKTFSLRVWSLVSQWFMRSNGWPHTHEFKGSRNWNQRIIIFFLSDRKLGIGKEKKVCLGQVRENNRGKYNQTTLYEILNWENIISSHILCEIILYTLGRCVTLIGLVKTWKANS